MNWCIHSVGSDKSIDIFGEQFALGNNILTIYILICRLLYRLVFGKKLRARGSFVDLDLLGTIIARGG